MSARLRLLFVADRFLFPVDAGGKIRTTQMLRGLKGGKFEITLISPGSARLAEQHATELAGVADQYRWWPVKSRGALFKLLRLRHVLAPIPIPIATDRSRPGQRLVARELARRPDVVVFDFLHSCILMPAALEAPAILFTHNVEAEIFSRHAQVAADPLRRLLWRDQHRKMRRFEQRCLQRFDTVLAVSERDRAAFARDYNVRNVAVIGTGVDLQYFAFQPDPRPGAVVFTGSMDWMANIDGIEFFMDEVWPLIVAAEPAATMTVVGRDPPESLVRRAGERKLAWTFTGRVDDVRPYVRQASACVIPLRVGGGTRLKVFEAMAMGCPVVSTAIGVEGLAVEHDRHYLRADSAALMAQSVVGLLRSTETRIRLARAARELVERQFSFRSIAREFERICLETRAAVQPASGEAACATSS